MDNTERENLEALTQSDGWRAFTAHVEGEWGAGGRAFVDAVTKAADNHSDASATAHLRQIIVAQKLIQRLMQWPDERLKTLKGSELQLAGARDWSRRGGL